VRTLGFGKHKDLQIERVMVDEPAYVLWMLNQDDASGSLARARLHIEARIRSFDARRFVNKCHVSGCTRPVKRYSLTSDIVAPYFWCKSCDPYSSGVAVGLRILKGGYLEALRYVEQHTQQTQDYRALVRALAKAKGLRSPATAARLEEFLR
jgi:hypothetical protein